ncbi:HNH endonuclease [Polaromonas sp. CT11-55]|uniref:HNH endonuclease n=1 Tax=Polaromonas sp. CT11-55 TaxID=3243045 RepID=UPI0039A40963
MSLPIELEPTVPMRVMDLVRDSGVDVSDWKNFKKGPHRAASNPKYCYEWAFIQPGIVLALNLWRRDMLPVNGGVEYYLNLRRDAALEPKGNVAARRRRMLEKIEQAYSAQLPVRVISIAGLQRTVGKKGGKPSRVELRTLDPVPWAITRINPEGEITLRRGVAAATYADQFSVPEDDANDPKKRSVTSNVYDRSATVRSDVLLRAMGHCELCKAPGFKLKNGSIFLETHHVIPLSEGGKDAKNNVVALCPNHHREAHYGSQWAEIRQFLLRHLQ